MLCTRIHAYICGVYGYARAALIFVERADFRSHNNTSTDVAINIVMCVYTIYWELYFVQTALTQVNANDDESYSLWYHVLPLHSFVYLCLFSIINIIIKHLTTIICTVGSF